LPTRGNESADLIIAALFDRLPLHYFGTGPPADQPATSP
jgi:hypothetical protein